MVRLASKWRRECFSYSCSIMQYCLPRQFRPFRDPVGPLSRTISARTTCSFSSGSFTSWNGRKSMACWWLTRVEKVVDRVFIKQLEAYFTKTATGRYRTQWIVPTPFFVSSELIYPIQAADLCIYCVNWGFRLPSQGMDSQTRPEIADEFGQWMRQLQFHGEGDRDGQVFESFGICFVPKPYGPGRA